MSTDPTRNPPISETPTVYIVDSDAPARESLACLFRSAGWWPRPAASAEEFLAIPRMFSPNCLITDLQLPGMGGLELQELVRDRTETPVIFVSGSPDVQSTVKAMKSGAFEFLLKPVVADLVLFAARSAIERSLAALRHQGQIGALRQRYDSLTPREREVMNLLVCGRLNKQVGGALGIAEETVKAHRGHLMRKMRAGSFAELVSMALNLNSLAPSCTPSHSLREPASEWLPSSVFRREVTLDLTS